MEDNETEIIYYYDMTEQRGFYYFADERSRFNIELEYLIDKAID